MIAARCLFALFVTLAAAQALEVRVDATGGAPRLCVDGQPVRARMFFGAPNMGPLKVGTAPGEVAFEFTALEDEPEHATLHFRFGHQPGEIDLCNLRVVDLGTGRDVLSGEGFQGLEKGLADFSKAWNIWPPGPQNTVATVTNAPGTGRDGQSALRIMLRAPANGIWPDFHFYHRDNLAMEKGHRYRVSFWCHASSPRALNVAFHRPGLHYDWLGGPDNGYEAQIKMAANAGARFITFPINLPWPKPGAAPDWRAVDLACQRVIDIDARVLLLPRIGMDAPAWWLDAHPDCEMRWDRPMEKHRNAVVYAPEYRREATQHLAALIAHLEEKFGARIAGYHPCGQNTGEWFYPETWAAAISGYAPADAFAWCAWLRAHYRDDAALRDAWRDPQATLATVVVPPSAERLAAPHGVLRDPLTERRLLDWADFRQEEMAETVCQLAHAVRTASVGRKLVCFFYGYVFEFGLIRESPAKAGHYALRRLLDCPDVDVLCSPISYFDRGLGESAPAMTAAESVALAGKMWLFEDDTHTYLAAGDPPGARDHVDTREKSVAELRRNTAQCALRNFATWWMDLGATGWFNDQGLWDEMRRLDALDTPLLKQPRAFKPEIAVVIDELAVREIAAGAE
ncbi:MAG: beta-galactosidase, partial [Kiritimatiellaeota bacterium]|nr:beta-galactosidase [Kiritimatiellota bacterium]